MAPPAAPIVSLSRRERTGLPPINLAGTATQQSVKPGENILLATGSFTLTNGTVRSLLEAAGLAARLECVVDSGIALIEKPDPRIFALAAEQLSVDASSCVYVGDFLSLDVHGARGAGMHGVLLDPIGAWGEVGVPSVTSLREFAARL